MQPNDPKPTPAKKDFKLSKLARASKLPRQIILGGFTLAWSPEKKCLVDYYGVPLLVEDAQYLLERAQHHLQHSAQELESMRKPILDRLIPRRKVIE